MSAGIFILIMFGGLIVFAVIVDLIAKRRGKKLDFENRDDSNISQSERIYAESFKDQVKQNMDQGFF
ncbi:hypothetical protein [Lentibacillus sp. Marseille-P4043]|uniref:hypothetical protein n=1 Tax=Lentibacillus sp. Marseille-P4043 TaxID=2040293 RepID=UPI000D0B6B5E|nr:hypothetical protein [Lentibacillus sp. Marseille-P4043]